MDMEDIVYGTQRWWEEMLASAEESKKLAEECEREGNKENAKYYEGMYYATIMAMHGFVEWLWPLLKLKCETDDDQQMAESVKWVEEEARRIFLQRLPSSIHRFYMRPWESF